MRILTLTAASALLAAACAVPLPDGEFAAGAWRTGLALSVADDAEFQNTDVDTDAVTIDVGKLLGPNGEFGARLNLTDITDTTVETASLGAYARWYFEPLAFLRPWGEVGAGFAGLDFGTGDESGWQYSLSAGTSWYFTSSLGLEVFLRHVLGNYETEDIRSTDLGVGVTAFW
jgi:hypothetical protein